MSAMKDEIGSAVARVDKASREESRPVPEPFEFVVETYREGGGGGGGFLGRENQTVGGIGSLVPFGRPGREENGKDERKDERMDGRGA